MVTLGAILTTSVDYWGQNSQSVPAVSNIPLVHAAPIIFETMSRNRPKPPPRPHRFVPLVYGGNSYLREVALTFDDGPSPVYTPQILAILKRFHAPATFFGIGSQVATWPALIRKEQAQGNELGDHTWDHANLTLLGDGSISWEMRSTIQAFKQARAKQPAYFRPPYGSFNADVLAQARKLHLMTVLWSIDPTDWERPGTPYIVNTIEKNMHNGSIVLMHDGGGDRSQTVAALPIVITWMHQHGYRIVSLQHLIDSIGYVPPVKAKHSPAGGIPLARSKSVIAPLHR